MGAKGKKQGIRMPCGWECGSKLTAREMRKHFTDCPKRPGNAAKPGDVILPPPKAPKRARKPKAEVEQPATAGDVVAKLAPVPVAMPAPSRPFFKSEAELTNYLIPNRFRGSFPKPSQKKKTR